MASITKTQKEALLEPILRNQESNKDKYTDATSLPGVEALLVAWGSRFIQEVQDNLDRLGKTDTGALGKNIQQGDVIQTGLKYELKVGYRKDDETAEYYDYQNKGVTGLKTGQPASSPYRFRTEKIHPVMARAILGWLQRGNASQRNEDQTKNLSQLQTKRTSFKDLSPTLGLAYVVALRIKNKGIERSGFFDDAITSVFNQEFYTAIGEVLGKDISLYIRKGIAN